MPRDDRDQNFEKALARSLGSSNAAPGASESPTHLRTDDCLDAETLAAYHERLLDPEEMAQRKAHIASCERCQEILAQLEATDRIAVEADRDLLLDQMILEIPDSESAAAAEPPGSAEVAQAADLAAEAVRLEQPAHAEPAREVETESEFILDPKLLHDPELVPTSAPAPSTERPHAAIPVPALTVGAPRSAPASAPASATITFRSPREGRPKMVRFVAMAGALAAGLILWFVYRDQTKQTEIAQNRSSGKLEELPLQGRSAAPAPLADSKDATATATPQNSAPSAPQSPSTAQPQPSASKAPTDSVSNSLDDAQKTLDTAKAIEKKSRKDAAAAQSQVFTPAPRDEAAPTGALDFARGSLSRASSAGAQHKLEAANQPSAVAPLRPVNNTAGDAATTIPSGIPATPPPARTKMNPGVVNETVTVDSAIPAPSNVQLSASAHSDVSSLPINGRNVATLVPLSVPAPSGKTIWRIGQAGVIQRSTDSGATWSIQPSGVVSDLIAGSAYSDQVCWLVGRNGTVLRTTNGGATWQKLTAPSSVDLLGVFSINADSATVTDAAGRAFETTSTGAHWTRTKLQQ